MELLTEYFNEFLTANIFLASLLALLLGFISSFSPCILSSVPLIIGYVGGYAGDNERKALFYSIAFASGIVVTFTILGIVTAMVGKALSLTGSWWYLFLGLLMILVGLQTLEVINIMPNRTSALSYHKGLLGAFLLGLFGGAFCAPCSAPALVVILALVADKGDIWYGILLLVFYAIGHASILIVAGSSIAMAEKLSKSKKTVKIGAIVKKVLGVIILLVALYLFYLGF
ncbi:MAG: cytochrome c biogenesis CcdA family protein [Bacilli bacterium]|jgi:cytochrome c-type biogenesis protein